MNAPFRNTFLFSWNPNKWPWLNIREESEQVKRGEMITERWTCSAHKRVQPGDRAFFSHVGKEPRGIFASGYIVSEPFIAKNRKGNDAHFVNAQYDVLLDPQTSPILTLDILSIGRMEKQLWTPQASGIAIRPELIEELEAVWKDFLENELR